VTSVAKVAHPGSEVVVSVTLPAPAPGAPRARGMVFIAGALEREGRFTPTGNLGRAMARVLDKDGAGRLPITIRVPSDATGRLHLAAVLQAATISAIPRPALTDDEWKADTVAKLDLAAPPNLAMTGLAAVGVATVGAPLEVRWVVTRTTPGPVGPFRITLTPQGGRPIVVEQVDGVSEPGTASGTVTVPRSARRDALLEATVSYAGQVASPSPTTA
jgi:hypothetical protein